MNQNADAFFKLLVPGIFFLLWALGQIFNREAAQSRNSRRSFDDPLGPRPERLNREPNRAVPEEDPFGPIVAAKPASTQRQNDGREILYDPRTGRPIGVLMPSSRSTEQAPDRATSPRARSRRGTESTRARKTAEPAAPPARTQLATPLSQQQSLTDAAFNAATIVSTDNVTLSAESVNSLLTSPIRVREAILMTQVLGPPPGLKNLRRKWQPR